MKFVITFSWISYLNFTLWLSLFYIIGCIKHQQYDMTYWKESYIDSGITVAFLLSLITTVISIITYYEKENAK